MGLFSKKPKAPKVVGKEFPGDSNSTTSFQSDHETLKSPISSNGRAFNRASGTGASIPNSAPFMPKVDMPKPPDPNLDPAAYLRSLGAVRERSKIVAEKAMTNTLNHFDVDMSKFSDVVSFVCGIIKVSHWWSQASPNVYTTATNKAVLIERLRRPIQLDPAPRTIPALLCWRPR